MAKYSNIFIVIAHSEENQSAEFLEKRNIFNYFLLSDCPGELQEPNARTILKEYVENYLNERCDYVLYGITLYTILIDRWIYAKYAIHPPIIPQEGIQEEMLKQLSLCFRELTICSIEEALKQKMIEADIVVSNSAWDTRAYLEKQFRCIDLYDCSDRIIVYKNSKIEKFENMHNGKRCFIVATGPSLTVRDLDLLDKNNEITFSVNGIIHIFEKTLWRPTYYVSDDYRAVQNNDALIDKIASEAIFIGDTYAPFWDRPHPENVYKYHKQYEYYYNRLPKFSTDFAQRSYTGLTVTYTCIQLAVYMGFKYIYLLGTDCNYVKGGDSNYFYSCKNKDFMDHQLDKTLLAYQSEKKYADEHGIKIFNATRGGMLEVFERTNFENLFN